jgi:hypothetical protein
MKRWFRWTLIVLTVGGGFAGVITIAEDFYDMKSPSALKLIPMWVFGVMYAFTIYSGLLIADDPKRTGPLMIVLLFQLFCFWSPLLSYRFTPGLDFLVTFGNTELLRRNDGRPPDRGFSLGLEPHVGSFYGLWQDRNGRWGFAINLVALAGLALVRKYGRPLNQTMKSAAVNP